MNPKKNDIINAVGGYAEFERLVRQGRQMHDQAVFGLFARLASDAVHFVRANLGSITRRLPSKRRRPEVCESVF